MADRFSSNLPITLATSVPTTSPQGVAISSTRCNPNPSSPTKLVFDKEEFSIRKRLPPNLPKRNNDVYVTNKTVFKAQLER